MSSSPSSPPATLRVAACQLPVGADKEANVRAAAAAVARAAADGAQFVVLPECFNSPYDTAAFPRYAEPVPSGDTCTALAAMARDNGVYLVGGSLPERDGEGDAARIYNTSVAFGPDGALLARHRKMHLFDIDVPGRVRFKESDTLTAGDAVTLFDTPYGRVGLAICYDVRFPLLAALMRARGARMLVYPGAFNTTTGPAHWELLLRTRAVDQQCFVVGCSPARAESAEGYQAHGHTSIIDPWGTLLATCDERPATVAADCRLAHADEVRAQIPVSLQARTDVYELLDKTAAASNGEADAAATGAQ